MNLIKERENDWDSVHDGGRALARVGMWGKWGIGSSEWRVDYAIRHQNRSVFMDLRKTLPRDYWRYSGTSRAIREMILYGMYAWMIELREKELNICYTSGGGSYMNNCDYLSDAFCVRDPIVLGLLFEWGMKLSRKSITNAMCWVPSRSLYPGQMGGFESPEAEREYLIETNREIVELLHPLVATYMHLMTPDCLQVNMDPKLHGDY